MPQPLTRALCSLQLISIVSFSFVCSDCFFVFSLGRPEGQQNQLAVPWSARCLLIPRRRIVLKELRHNFLQIPVVLIRVFLEVDSLAGVATPDKLLSSDVIHVHQQY